MFAKLKKKLAEEAATSPRPGGVARMPRSVSKESITSVGADSGDDFPSDGSSSREDLSSQLFRRNEQIRKLEVKLSDYAEQVRNLQKIKEKLENALETHQDSFVKKLQEQNEAHQASTAKMAEGTVLALEKKDQEWREKLSHLEKEKKLLSAQLQEMREKSLNLFQKRDEIDELEGFQQQELAKVKHMLLKKEESLAQMEQELGSSTQELQRTREELQTFRTLSSRQATELQQLRQQHAKLEAERDELIDAEESAESKITTLEQRSQELQAYIQQLSVDLQNAQVSAASCEKRLEALQREHNSLKQEYEQHKQKMIIEVEEKSQLVGHLQEKVTILEKRFEGNLSGDEHVQELLREKSALEQRLEEARQQLSAARTSHAESLSLLETQVKDLEHALQISNETAAKSKEEMEEKELQIQKLRTDLQLERIQGQEGLSTVQHQGTEQVGRLQEQMATLEAAQETERMAAHQTMSQLEKENEELKGRCKDLESSLRKQESELERLKAELSRSAETTQALEETRGQREHQLQQELVDLTVLLNEKDLLIAEKAEALLKAEEELKHLRQDYDALLLQMDQLQSSLELCQHQAMETEAAAEKRMSALQEQLQYQQERLLASEKQAATLELTSAALKKHLCPSEDGETEPNGEVAATDIVQLQKENRDMEQQIAEKNKTIKQLQQRMAELKKTLQKELKMRPDGEVPEVPTAALTVTNNSDLNDSREINFEYLKHVVLKFMSCRESEAFHLIKAMSVLLNFSQEEENMLKETLEYKMSWFGSKPSPRGSIRPSISSPRTPWS
ncbi:golgin subfamily A member 1 isoform X4 [Zootoca vivipara]|uniref:golgin subfamily A member 1 isoform X4 n=1 Tax=Zootoca vivipara TaxID=8524 RepID=UPI0015904535|nr:golgin subfamily A member 1 isoform X4 [Zootoca vivipara]XP_060126511.1 golgin subfamily A member 1 isoform X4 [Zootoca vivipara]